MKRRGNAGDADRSASADRVAGCRGGCVRGAIVESRRHADRVFTHLAGEAWSRQKVSGSVKMSTATTVRKCLEPIR